MLKQTLKTKIGLKLSDAFQSSVSEFPSWKMLLAAFGAPFSAAFVFSQLNVREFNLTMNRSHRTVDPNSLAVLKSESEDYKETIEYGFENAISSLDWAVIGTHLSKIQEFEFAFHSYYIAYLLSNGRTSPLRDWCHESLHELSLKNST